MLIASAQTCRRATDLGGQRALIPRPVVPAAYLVAVRRLSTELLDFARGLASANGDGPDPGLVSEVDALVANVVRDDTGLLNSRRTRSPPSGGFPFRQAAERVAVDPAGVARDLERRLSTSRDRETGRLQTRLEALNGLSGDVEFAVEPSQFDNGDWLFELMGKRPPKEGVVVKVRRSERQVTMPRDLEDRIA